MLLVYIFPEIINYDEVDNIQLRKLLLLIVVMLVVVTLSAVSATDLAAGADEIAVFCYDIQDIGHSNPIPWNSTVEGRLNWNYLTKGDVSYSPAAVNEIVYVGSDDHNINALIVTDMRADHAL